MDYIANTQDLIKCLNVLYTRTQRANNALQAQIEANDETLAYIDKLIESILDAQVEDAEATVKSILKEHVCVYGYNCAVCNFTKKPL